MPLRKRTPRYRRGSYKKPFRSRKSRTTSFKGPAKSLKHSTSNYKKIYKLELSLPDTRPKLMNGNNLNSIGYMFQAYRYLIESNDFLTDCKQHDQFRLDGVSLTLTVRSDSLLNRFSDLYLAFDRTGIESTLTFNASTVPSYGNFKTFKNKNSSTFSGSLSQSVRASSMAEKCQWINCDNITIVDFNAQGQQGGISVNGIPLYRSNLFIWNPTFLYSDYYQTVAPQGTDMPVTYDFSWRFYVTFRGNRLNSLPIHVPPPFYPFTLLAAGDLNVQPFQEAEGIKVLTDLPEYISYLSKVSPNMIPTVYHIATGFQNVFNPLITGISNIITQTATWNLRTMDIPIRIQSDNTFRQQIPQLINYAVQNLYQSQPLQVISNLLPKNLYNTDRILNKLDKSTNVPLDWKAAIYKSNIHDGIFINIPSYNFSLIHFPHGSVWFTMLYFNKTNNTIRVGIRDLLCQIWYDGTPYIWQDKDDQTIINNIYLYYTLPFITNIQSFVELTFVSSDNELVTPWSIDIPTNASGNGYIDDITNNHFGPQLALLMITKNQVFDGPFP